MSVRIRCQLLLDVITQTTATGLRSRRSLPMGFKSHALPVTNLPWANTLGSLRQGPTDAAAAHSPVDSPTTIDDQENDRAAGRTAGHPPAPDTPTHLRSAIKPPRGTGLDYFRKFQAEVEFLLRQQYAC